MYLPNELIEYIAYMADIDVRRALNIQPRKLSDDQKNLNLKFKTVMFFDDSPYILLTIYGQSSIIKLKIFQGSTYRTELHKTTVSRGGTHVITENYNIS